MKTWQKLRNTPALWERYFIREKVLTAIRRFFLDRGFHEAETPLLTGSLPPESYVDVFETTLLDRHRRPTRAFLPASPEPFLKKLLVAGIGNCFSITKSFRNTENQSKTHNPEFTILEWYRVDADYTGIMKDCEELLMFINTYLIRSKASKGALDTKTLVYQGKKVDLRSPWERLSISQAFKKYADVHLERALTEKEMVAIAKKKGHAIGKHDNWEELFFQIFFNEVEPHLNTRKPIILYDYPRQLAALAAKEKAADPRLVERFEVYVAGIELADGCSELTDWQKQNARFKHESTLRKQQGKPDYPMDEEFIEALKIGMPKCAGIAMGVDRLIMLFADVKDIADTLFFPVQDLFE